MDITADVATTIWLILAERMYMFCCGHQSQGPANAVPAAGTASDLTCCGYHC